MKYTMFIDQIHSIEWGLNLQEAAIFNFLYSVPTWAEAKLIDGKLFYHASRNKAIQDYPIVSEKPDTVYRIYRRLQSAGVIEWMKDGLKDMILITEKGKQWNNSEKNPTLIQELGKKSDQTRKKIRNSSENFPTYTSTINTVTNNTIEELQKENDLLITAYGHEAGLEVTTYEIMPHDIEGNDEFTIPSTQEQTPTPNSAAPPSPSKKAKAPKYIYPPTQEELVAQFYTKLQEKKRQHPQIVDCWNWANMEAEKFFLHWERKNWQIQKLGNAIATWVNGSITFGTVTKPCPIQYKGNPANTQPAQPTKVHVEERPVLTQHDIEYSQAAFASVEQMFKQMGV